MKNTTNMTEIKNTKEDKEMKKYYELKKFTDECLIKYEWELEALYQAREHFMKDFYELYVNGAKGSEKVRQAMPMIINYVTEFATGGRVWDSILATSKYKSFYAKKWEYDHKEMNESTKTKILNSYRPTENDTDEVVYRIYATIAVAVYNATFAPDGQYRVAKMAYRDYKNKSILASERYSYTCIDTSKCTAAYVKTGKYDPETKTIEVYIPANWGGDDARWWCARKAGDLPEIAAEMAAQRAAEAETETEEKESETEESEMKEKFIEMVDKYYDESCYEAEELVVSEETREECRELVAYSEGPEDSRDKTVAEIHRRLIEYLQTLPEEHFEEVLADYDIYCIGFDEMVDLIYYEYADAPFEVDYDTGTVRVSLKTRYIEVAESAPAKFFANGVDEMTEDEVRAKLIEYYKKCDEEDFEDMECIDETDGEYEAVCNALRAEAVNQGLIDRNAVIAGFYEFFAEVQNYTRMHMEVYYSHIMDWCIYIDKQGCADDYPNERNKGEDAVVADVQSCDNAIACAKAHGALRRWMKKYHNYEED